MHSNRQETVFTHDYLPSSTYRPASAGDACTTSNRAALFFFSEGLLRELIKVTPISCVQDARRTVLFRTQSSFAVPQCPAPAGYSVHDEQAVLVSFFPFPEGPLGPLTMQVPQLGSRL